jgi:hypothetical protein
MTNLRIEVRDDEIVVTLPGTSYRAVYHKPADKPGLIATSRSGRWEQGTPMTQRPRSMIRPPDRAWRSRNTEPYRGLNRSRWLALAKNISASGSHRTGEDVW